MAILVNQGTRVLIQGITGTTGAFQTRIMLEYGTLVVSGVTPGKAGQTVHGVPVFDFVQDAVAATQANAAIVFVPGLRARDAALEALDAGIKLVVLPAEGIPDHDMLDVTDCAERCGAVVIGPDTPGVISPGRCKLGGHPNRMFMPGPVGVLSKSGALSYEVSKLLTAYGIGQTTVVGIGGGPLWGLSQRRALALFENDPETRAVVLLGEVGGTMEQEAALWIREHMTKPVVALIVGRAAPQGARMGHAGAIIEGEEGTAASKMAALRAAGVHVASSPTDVPAIIHRLGVA